MNAGHSHVHVSLMCRPVLCCAVLCCAVLCCAVLCCAVLCCSKRQRLNSACPFSEASSSCKIQPRQHLDHEVMLVSHTLHLFLYSCSTVQQSLPTNAEKTVDGQELLRWSSAFWEPPEQGKTLGAQAASVEAQLQLYSCSRACTNAARATVPCVAWLSKGETPAPWGSGGGAGWVQPPRHTDACNSHCYKKLSTCRTSCRGQA